MRVLLTNDDGVHAPGLRVAERIASKLNGGDVDVWVAAPANENSGVAHCISYTKPVRTEKIGHQVFSVDGTPADCVLVALSEIMADALPDLVISGVNRGNNAAENTLYSGTVGGAMEAALQGHRAVALSQFMGPKTRDLQNTFEAAEAHAAPVLDTLFQSAAWLDRDYGVFYNVNFPPCPANVVAGVKATRQGFRPECVFKARAYDAPNMRRYYWLVGGDQQRPSAPGTDAHANLDGYISVTPARADLTAHELVDDLAALWEG